MFAIDFDNPWVKDVEATWRRLAGWVCILVALTVAAIVLFAAREFAPTAETWTLGAAHSLPPPWPSILSQAMALLLVFGLLLAAAVTAAGIEGRSPWRRGPRPITALMAGLALGGGGILASVGITWLAGAVGDRPTAPVAASMGGVTVGVLSIVFQTVSEEAYFRGWLQPVLCARWGPWLGLLGTSALFAGLHVIGRAHGLLTVLNLCLGGMVFGLLALRSGGLVAPAAAHFAWNWTEAGGLGLASVPGGSITGLHLLGRSPWGGGADGMNGSPASTLVLACLIVALVLFDPSRSGRPAGRRSDPVP